MPDPSKEQVAYAEALRRIEACRQQGSAGTDLDLSEQGLATVPLEIFKLKALTKLNLSQNPLCILPP